jgi:hypothetical protein
MRAGWDGEDSGGGGKERRESCDGGLGSWMVVVKKRKKETLTPPGDELREIAGWCPRSASAPNEGGTVQYWTLRVLVLVLWKSRCCRLNKVHVSDERLESNRI